MKKFMILALVAILAVLPSCKFISDSELDGLSVVTSDSLVSPDLMTDSRIIQIPDSMFPVKLKDNPKWEGKHFVFAPDELIKPGSPRIDLTPDETSIWILDVLAMIASIAKTFVPQLAVLEVILALLSKRKRQNYKDAIAAVVPYDGNVDIVGALVSVAKALGVSHSRPDPVATITPPPAPPAAQPAKV
jgi:hypothetical protein